MVAVHQQQWFGAVVAAGLASFFIGWVGVGIAALIIALLITQEIVSLHRQQLASVDQVQQLRTEFKPLLDLAERHQALNNTVADLHTRIARAEDTAKEQGNKITQINNRTARS